MPLVAARLRLGLSVLALVAGPSLAKSPPTDRLGVVDTLIHEIQGNGLASPMVGSHVTTTGVVTAVVADGYFLQSLPGQEDADPATSEGLFVFTGGSDPSVAVGQQREASGLVQEVLRGETPHQLTLTQLAATPSTLVASGLALPAPVAITGAELSPDADVDALERFEGMRVSIQRMVVVGAAGASIDASAQTAQSDGVIHAVWGQDLGLDAEPPFREPGLSLLDTRTPPLGKDLPMHDANPQVLRIDSLAQAGAPLLDLGRNDRLRNAVGVLGYEEARYSLLIDPASPLEIEPRPRGQVPDPTSPAEIRLAWVDLGELYDASDDLGVDDPVPSPAGYQARLDRIARSLCEFMLNPQVIAVSGAENLQVLRDLSTVIETNPSGQCPQPRRYQAVLVEGDDPRGLDIGFLVSAEDVQDLYRRVAVLDVAILAETESSPHPAGGAEPLFTTPPLVARLGLTDGSGSSTGFTVVNVKFRELDGAGSPAPGQDGWATVGEQVMTLRARQAAWLAGWLEARQQLDANEAIAVLGGFDADAFNDGRVDVMGIVTGQPAPDSQSWVALPSPLTTPLTNLTLLAIPAARYNANERGDYRALDHILVNEAMRRTFAVVPATTRINADFPASQRLAPGGIGFSSRDPLVARVSANAQVNADLVASVPAAAGNLNPNVPDPISLHVFNLGPNAAPQVELQVRSTLAPGQWSLSNVSSGWTCGPTQPHDAGSRAQCSGTGLSASTLAVLNANIDPDPALEGGSATFTASVSGSYTDANPANNESSRSFAFDSRVDLSVQLAPLDGGADLTPGTDGGWSVTLVRDGTNSPGPVDIVLEVDAVASEVSIGLHDGGLACDAGLDIGPRRSRFTCQATDYTGLEITRFVLRFPTSPFDGSRIIGLTAAATFPGIELDPDDNVASASLRVADAADLVLAGGSGQPTLPDVPASLYFSLRNGLQGVARNARLEFLVDLPPAAIAEVETVVSGQTPDIWQCQPAQPHDDGSRIECAVTSPLLQPQFPSYTWGFRVRFTPPFRPGLTDYRVTARGTASSDSDEQSPADNTAENSLLVDQSSDLESLVDGPFGPVVEPDRMQFNVGAYVAAGLVPQDPRARLAFNATFERDDVQTQLSSGEPVDCLTAPAPAGQFALDCPLRLDNNLFVFVRTRPDLAGTTLRLTTTVSSELGDANPANNVTHTDVQVIAEYDLCLGASCAGLSRPDPHSVIRGSNSLPFVFRNRGQSTAQDALATIEVGLPAAAVAARVGSRACSAAEPVTSDSARILCELGDVAGLTPAQTLVLDADTTGYAGDGVDLVITLSASPGEILPMNNQLSKRLPVVPGIDLSATVQAKRASYPDHAEFVLTLAVEGEGNAPASELLLAVDIGAPLPSDSLEIRSQGWLCGSFTSGLVDRHEFYCERLWPIPAGSASLMTLRVPTDQFIQIGRDVRVSATHRFPPLALATDLIAENDTDSDSILVEGRSTRSTQGATQPTPAYGERRQARPTPLRTEGAPRARD
jgi:hypothetical protein